MKHIENEFHLLGLIIRHLPLVENKMLNLIGKMSKIIFISKKTPLTVTQHTPVLNRSIHSISKQNEDEKNIPV